MDPIKYDIGEYDDMELFVEIFEVLCRYLPVQSQLSKEAALAQIVEILPERTPIAPDSLEFHMVALYMAGQTPYKHPSMSKLSSIVVSMIATYDSKDCMIQSLGRAYPAQWYHTAIGEHLAGPGDEKYVNELAYISQTDAALKGEIVFGTLLPFLQAFEEDEKNKEATTMAAALRMINQGAAIYEASFYSEHDIKEEFSNGPKYQKVVNSRGGFVAWVRRLSKFSQHEHKPYLTPDRWSFWKQGFRDVAAYGGKSELVELAGEAARKMDELEAQTANSSTTSLAKESKAELKE